jgi:phosphate transport system protein
MELETRHEYREELERLEGRALEGLDLVVSAVDRTIEAVQHQDIELAELVIADDDVIDGRYLEVHQSILALLATQAPVATDLRLISALLHIMKNIERMGDQCVNIGKLIPLGGHEPPADERMLPDRARDRGRSRPSRVGDDDAPRRPGTRANRGQRR